MVLRIKGDGKRYQFRLKADQKDYYSYISYFDTTGEWEDLKIPLSSLYAVFRGRRLNLPGFTRKPVSRSKGESILRHL